MLPPSPKPEKTISFPKYEAHDLANGLRVLVIEHHKLPVISLRFLVKSGSAGDGDFPGLASITGELLTKGTTARSALQIAEEIDYVGGQLVSGSDWDATYTSATVLKKHLGIGLSLVADVSLNPAFSDEEIERARQQRLTMLLQRRDDADYLAEEEFNTAVFADHPYAKPQIGTESSVKALARGDFLKFHKTYFVPSNTLLAIVGDVTSDEIMPRIEKSFGSWEQQPRPVESINSPADLDESSIYVVDKPGAVQSAIRVGHVGIARKCDDFVSVVVLNTVLGGYFNSRMNSNLRESKGYTYGAHTTFDVRRFRGPFIASADVRNEVTEAAITEMLYELERIRKDPVAADELDMVKRFLVGSFPLQLETPSQIAGKVIDLELYDLPRDFYDTFNDCVSRTTADDLLCTAQKYLHPDRLAIVVSGSPKEVASKLEKFGAVKIVDVDGRLLSQ
jgi:zinc protease